MKKRVIQSKQLVVKPNVSEERKSLENKVQEGARRAVREYGEVFKKLASHDGS